MEAVDFTNERIGRGMAYVGAVMMFTVIYEVAMRYIFNRPTKWAFEVNQSLLCFYVALAGGYTLLHRGHVNVDILYHRFGGKTRIIIDLLTSLLFFGFIIIFLWQTWDMAFTSLLIRERSEGLFKLPQYPAKMAIVVGVFLVLLQGLVTFIRNIIALITGREPPRPPAFFGEVQK